MKFMAWKCSHEAISFAQHGVSACAPRGCAPAVLGLTLKRRVRHTAQARRRLRQARYMKRRAKLFQKSGHPCPPLLLNIC